MRMIHRNVHSKRKPRISNKVLLKVIEIILIPVSLFIFGAIIESSLSKRQETLQQIISASQETITITQIVDTFYQGIGDVLSNSDLEDIQAIILARSRSLISHLDSLNRTEEIVGVMRFLSEVYPFILEADVFEQDPQSEPSFIDLSHINFSHSDFRSIFLKSAQLSYSNFTHSHMYNVECIACDLSNTNFQSADLLDVDLTGAILWEANFTGAEITNVLLDGADLSGATWIDGKKCKKNSIGRCL